MKSKFDPGDNFMSYVCFKNNRPFHLFISSFLDANWPPANRSVIFGSSSIMHALENYRKMCEKDKTFAWYAVPAGLSAGSVESVTSIARSYRHTQLWCEVSGLKSCSINLFTWELASWISANSKWSRLGIET